MKNSARFINYTKSISILYGVILCPMIRGNSAYADIVYDPVMETIRNKNILQLFLFNMPILLIVTILILIHLYFKKRRQKQTDKELAKPITPITIKILEDNTNTSVGSTQRFNRLENQKNALGIARNKLNEQLFIIADGMGDFENGAAAAQMCANGVLDAFNRISISPKQIPCELERWIHQINQRIYQTFQKQAGTTVTCVWISKNNLYWISVGDSKLYLFRQERLYQINEDHIWLKELYQSFMYGKITAEELINSKGTHNLTSNLGREEIPEFDKNDYPFEIKPGDHFLLCSDRVSANLENNDIINALQTSDAQQCCMEIVKRISENDDQMQSNYSAIAFFF